MARESRKIKKILIANRGEIAARLIRATRDLGLKSAIVFSEADQASLPVRLADERIPLIGSNAKETYLNQDAIILAAIESQADAIHPAYGFLSENDEFAKKVEESGLIFIGPSSKTIFQMGDKLRARQFALNAKVPILEGKEYDGNIEEINDFAQSIGFPVIIKAASGGSGRGIRICEKKEDLKTHLEDASKEAISAFGSGTVYVEKFLLKPRHIEVQIISDKHGNHHHLFDRECSLQRRRQKLVEEAQAPNLNPKLATAIRESALRLARLVNYDSVGTMEFLVDGGEDETDHFYFLEMNTRLQVEHTVSEEVSGIDIAKLQIEIAEGRKLDQEFVHIKTLPASIQFRVYAEDPRNNFQPSLGRISYCHFPSGPGVRVDAWAETGTVISPYYDALLGKIIVTGNTREEALKRAARALYETRIEGVKSNLGFFRWLLTQSDYLQAKVHINWVDQNFKEINKELESRFVGSISD